MTYTSIISYYRTKRLLPSYSSQEERARDLEMILTERTMELAVSPDEAARTEQQELDGLLGIRPLPKGIGQSTPIGANDACAAPARIVPTANGLRTIYSITVPARELRLSRGTYLCVVEAQLRSQGRDDKDISRLPSCERAAMAKVLAATFRAAHDKLAADITSPPAVMPQVTASYDPALLSGSSDLSYTVTVESMPDIQPDLVRDIVKEHGPFTDAEALLAALDANCRFAAPPTLVDMERELTPDRAAAERRVRLGLLLGTFADKNHIKVDDVAVYAAVSRNADPAEIEEHYYALRAAWLEQAALDSLMAASPP